MDTLQIHRRHRAWLRRRLAEDTAGSAAVLDDYALAQRARKSLRDDPRDRIAAGPGRERNDQLDRLAGEGLLRLHAAGGTGAKGSEEGQARAAGAAKAGRKGLLGHEIFLFTCTDKSDDTCTDDSVKSLCPATIRP